MYQDDGILFVFKFGLWGLTGGRDWRLTNGSCRDLLRWPRHLSPWIYVVPIAADCRTAFGVYTELYVPWLKQVLAPFEVVVDSFASLLVGPSDSVTAALRFA